MLDMLPDVYDWPIAVDNWEAEYGKASVCQHNKQFPPLNGTCRLFSSGKLWRLEDVIAKLNVKYGSQLVINFFIGIDDKDSSSYIIHVSFGLGQVGECSFCNLGKVYKMH